MVNGFFEDKALGVGDLVAFDTASALISVPIDVARALFSTVPRAFPVYASGDQTIQAQPNIDGWEIWALPCQTPPKFAFMLGEGASAWVFTLDARDINVGRVYRPIPDPHSRFRDLPGRSDYANAMAGPVPFCLASIVGEPPGIM